MSLCQPRVIRRPLWLPCASLNRFKLELLHHWNSNSNAGAITVEPADTACIVVPHLHEHCCVLSGTVVSQMWAVKVFIRLDRLLKHTLASESGGHKQHFRSSYEMQIKQKNPGLLYLQLRATSKMPSVSLT